MEIRYDKKVKKFIEAQDRPTKQRIKNGILGLRTCLHKKYIWIFEYNLVNNKAKKRRRT